MHPSSSARSIGLFLALIVGVVALSIFFRNSGGGKPEVIPATGALTLTADMTVAEFGAANQLPNPMLKEIFGLTNSVDLQKPLSNYGTSAQIESQVRKKTALAAEHASKDWRLIGVKFMLWIMFLGLVFFFFRKRKTGVARRKWLLATAVLVFGVIMGADPSPMGTVKDAIHLFGASQVIFPPRLIALAVFLLMVWAANKFICGWGCQLGTLQDLVFRLNRNAASKAIVGRQYKPAFAVTNTIRIAFLAVFTVATFAWGTDLIEPIDPFRIYKPLTLGIIGMLFIGLILIAALFVYRPWCHFFCPFGLTGWLVEKISRVKISVDYTTCIACEKCAAVCPSTVMSAILKQDKKTIPDCFACMSCTDACPTGAVAFSTRSRSRPPADHFNQKQARDTTTP